jgi:type IV pilus assembly protein PilM
MRAAKLRTEKAQAAKTQAARVQAETAQSANAHAEKAEAEKAQAAKAEAEKAEAEKAQQAAKEQAEKAEAEKAKAAKAKAEKAQAEKAQAEQAKAAKAQEKANAAKLRAEAQAKKAEAKKAEAEAKKKEKQPKPTKPRRERRSLKVSVPKPKVVLPKVALPKAKVALPKPKLALPKVALPKLNLSFGRGKDGQGVKRLVGLHIGASQLAAARVANNGSAELLQLARTSLEPGIVVGGELRDPEKLTEALRSFFKEHDLPREGVRLGVANNRIGVRTFEIVGITDPKQLDNAVRFRAQETLPIPIEEAVLDYQVLSDRIGPDNLSVKNVLLVVAYRESIDRYVDACRKAGIELVGIDLDAFALLRAMSAPREDVANAALVVVSIGHERSTFAVSNGKTCEFTRVLEWGGNSLGVALARALNTAPSEAESVKHALDLGATEPPADLTAEQFALAKDAARRQIQSFARELASSLQFYQNQPGSLSIGEIVLTGGTSHMPGLATELQQLIGVTVRVGDPLLRVRVGKKAIGEDERQIGSLATAIGLGIED